MQELKSYTEKEANKVIREMESEEPASMENILGAGAPSSKSFWQAESFDRIVRNRNDMAKKIRYTLNNPVKVGLVSKWQDWKWSYCRKEFLGE